MRNFLRRQLDNFVDTLGGVVLSHRAHAELLAQRDRAVAELTALEQPTLKPGLSGVIFSKDRALQLHALLGGYQQLVTNPAPLTVIYNASGPVHAKAYAEVVKLFPKVTFVRETRKFRDHLLEVLAGIKTKNIFFLVDDIVFIRPLDLKLAARIDATGTLLSFRLAPTFDHSYTTQLPQKPPAMRPAPEGRDLLEFDWQPAGNNEWSYPYSVDGHVFPTAEIRVLTRLASFKAPNSYEGALMAFAGIAGKRRGLCYRQAKIVNLPINKVQTENANLAGNVSTEDLLAQWNRGMTLDTAKFRGLEPTSPHMDLPVSFIKR